MDLATPGVVAVHALVPAADIWALLPRLESGGSEFDPDSARREDGPVSTPVKTDRAFTIDEIVNSTFASAETRRSSSGRNFFDATTSDTPERAVAYGDIPTAAVLAAAQSGAHLARRPASRRPHDGGLARCHARAPLDAVAFGGNLRAQRTRLLAHHERGTGPSRGSRANRRLHPAQRLGRRRRHRRAARNRRGLGDRRRASDRRHGLRHGVDRAGRQDLRSRAAAPSTRAKLIVSRDVAIDLPAGPSEIVVVADEGVDEAIIAQEIAAQMEHGPDSRGFVVRVGDDLEAALARSRRVTPRSTSFCWASAPSRWRHGFATPERSSSVPTRRCPRATTPPAATTSCPPAAGRSRPGDSGLEAFMKTVTVQRVTKEGLERLAPTIEALAELEGMTRAQGHGAAMKPVALEAYQWPPSTEVLARRVGIDPRVDRSLRRQRRRRARRRVRVPAALARALADVNEYDRGRYLPLARSDRPLPRSRGRERGARRGQ